VKRAYIGIDLGTSSVRTLALDPSGVALGVTGRAYETRRPLPDRAEQDPGQWWALTCEALRELLTSPEVRGREIVAVGMSGQMHGLVLVDGRGVPVRPAIIWPDTRTTAQLDAWHRRFGDAGIERLTGQPPALGMYGLSLDWVRTEEPGSYARAALGLLPKDLIRMRLTGVAATDATDACGTLLFDAGRGAWSDELVAGLGLRRELLPDLAPSLAIAGSVTDEAAEATGLRAGTPVAVGGSDQSMAALGLGLGPGDVLMAVSTGGTVVAVTDRVPSPMTGRGLHLLAHAVEGRWLVMSAILAAGDALGWLAEALEGASGHAAARIGELVGEGSGTVPGAGGLLFLPHLSGERLDGEARGAFIGLVRAHSRADLARAIMEGVGFALRASLEAILEVGLPVERVVLSGGGFRSGPWRQLQADILGRAVRYVATEEHSARGAATCAAAAAGEPVDLRALQEGVALEPGRERSAFYEERFALYRLADARVRDVSHALAAADRRL
jgi:xylulokinase